MESNDPLVEICLIYEAHEEIFHVNLQFLPRPGELIWMYDRYLWVESIIHDADYETTYVVVQEAKPVVRPRFQPWQWRHFKHPQDKSDFVSEFS